MPNVVNTTSTAGTHSNANTDNASGFFSFTLDPSHPFYIHPYDNPGSQLVAVPFSGCSFVLWRSSMLTSLSAKNKLGVLDGRYPQPTPDSPYYSYWERCNDMIKAWITNFVSREIATSVMCLRTTREVWLDINECFGQSNGSKYIQIQREISSTIQGSFDIATYFTKLRTLWDELNSSYVGPDCTCGALVKFIKDQRLFQFLNGLNDSYSTVKSNILMMRPLPPISRAYSLLQQDESQKETHSTPPCFSNGSASFFAPSSSSSVSNSGRSYNQKVNFDPKRNINSLFCRYCKRPGHSVEKFYKLHGFPPDFKFTKNKRSASCVQAEAQLSSGVQLSSGSPSTSLNPSSEPTPHGFSKDQYEHLMTMFQLAQISSGSPSDASLPDNTTYAHFAGPFTEEASGYW